MKLLRGGTGVLGTRCRVTSLGLARLTPGLSPEESRREPLESGEVRNPRECL